MTYIDKQIGKDIPTHLNTEVRRTVVANLRHLIPGARHVADHKMEVLNKAVNQLCQAEDVSEIDWLKLVNLAADINSLYCNKALY